MIYSALFAYLHYASILGLAGSLIVELVIYNQNIHQKELKILQKADSIYGLTAILVVATGLIRTFYFEKGSEYYWGNYVFLTKFSLFVIIGLLSIYPTVVFLKWGKELKKSGTFQVMDQQHSYISKIIRIEVILLFIIPLLAAMMARGYGY